jgi:mannose-6-phosphate isomerase-like protein (cupin superfamily)
VQIKIGDEIAKFREGDVIYIPEKTSHSITNDGNEMVEFLAFGGFTGMKKGGSG